MNDDTVRSTKLIQLYNLWLSKRDRRPMPARRDFDPVEMVQLLPHLFMLDIMSAPRAFRYRLIGTSIVNLLGRDMTGKFVDEAVYGKSAEGLRRIFNLVVDTAGPVVAKGHVFYIKDRNWLSVEAFLVPLSTDGAAIDIILAGMVRSQGTGLQQADSPGGISGMDAFPDPIVDGVRHSSRIGHQSSLAVPTERSGIR